MGRGEKYPHPKYLLGLPARDVFARRMAVLLDYEQVSALIKRDNRYFFTPNSSRDNQYVLSMREGLNGALQELIDPNLWSADSGDALAEWSVSDDGKLIAYGVQQGGTDWRTIRVLDTDTGEVLEDRVQWARFTDIAWAPDGSGFFYARFPEGDSAKTQAGIVNHAVYFHLLGAQQSTDRPIFLDPERPAYLVPIKRTPEGRYLGIYSMPGVGANGLAVVDLESPDWTAGVLVAEANASWSYWQ